MFKAFQLYTNFRKFKKNANFSRNFWKTNKLDFSQNHRKISISVKKSWKINSTVFVFGKSLFNRMCKILSKILILLKIFKKKSKDFDLSKKFRKIKILVKIVQNLDLSKSSKSIGTSQFCKSLIFVKISKKLILIKRTQFYQQFWNKSRF